MPTNKQRRETARRQLERQLERRQQREASRKRVTTITSIVGSIVLIAVVIVVIIAVSHDDKGSSTATGTSASATPTTSPTTSPTAAASSSPAVRATGPAVAFDGVSVAGAADLKGEPIISSKGGSTPSKVEYKDLVVGTGAAAKPTDSVEVQYEGALYSNGKLFDSSWQRGMPADFPLSGVVKGFTQGIGGTTGIPPMKIGGRRVMIIPASLGYGSTANGSIPANSTLVFVVDLLKTGVATSS